MYYWVTFHTHFFYWRWKYSTNNMQIITIMFEREDNLEGTFDGIGIAITRGDENSVDQSQCWALEKSRKWPKYANKPFHPHK